MRDTVVIASYWDDARGQIQETSISQYEGMLNREPPDAGGIADMIYHRFHARYLRPYLSSDSKFQAQYLSGFAMMASGCLLIEALESFRFGWDETPRDEGGKRVIERFFDRSKKLKALSKTEFYRDVRCGLLHQGETKSGFLITRGSGSLFDADKKRINASKFLKELETCLASYRDDLKRERWDSEIWDNCRRKMRFIIANCRVA